MIADMIGTYRFTKPAVDQSLRESRNKPSTSHSVSYSISLSVNHVFSAIGSPMLKRDAQ